MNMLRIAGMGCLAGALSLAAPATFNKDVLPILQQNCQSCHRPGEVAPMSLLTYTEARPWAKAIKSAVEAGLGVGFVSRWAIAKELELGILKIVEVPGLRVTRSFSLARRTGPVPQGPAGCFRSFAIERVRAAFHGPPEVRCIVWDPRPCAHQRGFQCLHHSD